MNIYNASPVAIHGAQRLLVYTLLKNTILDYTVTDIEVIPTRENWKLQRNTKEGIKRSFYFQQYLKGNFIFFRIIFLTVYSFYFVTISLLFYQTSCHISSRKVGWSNTRNIALHRAHDVREVWSKIQVVVCGHYICCVYCLFARCLPSSPFSVRPQHMRQ